MAKAFYISDLPTTIINESKLVSLEEAALFMTNRGDKYAYFDFKSKVNCYFLLLQTRELNAAGIVIKEGTFYLPNIFIKPGEKYSTEEPLPLEKDCYSLELFIKYAEFDEKILFNDQKISNSKKTDEILLETKTFLPNLTPEIGMGNAPVDMSWKKGKEEKMPLFNPFEKKEQEKPMPIEGEADLNAEIARLQAEKGLLMDKEPMVQPAEAIQEQAPVMQEQPIFAEQAPVEQQMPQEQPMFSEQMQQQPVEQQMQNPQNAANQQLPLVKAKVTSKLPIVAIAIATVLFVALIFFVIYYQSLFVSQAG